MQKAAHLKKKHDLYDFSLPAVVKRRWSFIKLQIVDEDNIFDLSFGRESAAYLLDAHTHTLTSL